MECTISGGGFNFSVRGKNTKIRGRGNLSIFSGGPRWGGGGAFGPYDMTLASD